ncbi:MAG: ATP-grasp domain-containing protein [Bradymonadaceae bacterium]|nr:ATP-grasp domain-containing protein [Lujinxingiaceae bacterium]
MRNVVFVAPHITANTLRYVDALCALPEVRAALISSDPLGHLPQPLRQRLAAFETATSSLDGAALAAAASRLVARIGPIDRLFGALEQLQLPIAHARDVVGIPGMGVAIVTRFRDKSAMKAALRQAEVPCARYARVTSTADATRFADEVGYPMIIKPIDGLGTRSTWRLENDDELAQALRSLAPSPAQPVQCEEFLLGSEHSFETVTIDGRHIWSSSTNYLPGPLEAMNTPWIQYCVVLPRETDTMERFRPVNHAALDALGMITGLSHMELFNRNDTTVAVNEVGARPPGVNIMPLMSHAHGTDFVRAWIRLMALDQFDPPQRHHAAGTAFLRGHGPGTRVIAIHGLDAVLEELGGHVVELSRPQLGQQRATGYEGEGFAVVCAPSTAEVMHALARLIRNVRIVYG